MKQLSYSMFANVFTCLILLVASCQKKPIQSTSLTQANNTSGGLSETDIAKDLSMLLSIYLPDKDYLVLIESQKKGSFYDLKTVTKAFAGNRFNPTAKRICQGIEQDFNQCVATLLKKEGCAKIYKENDFQYFACGCK